MEYWADVLDFVNRLTGPVVLVIIIVGGTKKYRLWVFSWLHDEIVAQIEKRLTTTTEYYEEQIQEIRKQYESQIQEMRTNFASQMTEMRVDRDLWRDTSFKALGVTEKVAAKVTAPAAAGEVS